MTPRIGLITPVKAALGQWMVDFFAQFDPDTPANAEWASRPAAQAMAWAPARMVDSVEEMLSAWKRNDNSNGGGSTSAYLPALFIAVASDYTESPGEAGRPLTDYMPITFEDDAQKRSFRVRMMSVDLRGQVVVVAPEAMSAMSIIGQLCMWCVARRVIHAPFGFAGFTTNWPATILSADRMAIPTPLGEQMSILTLDLTIRASLPLFKGPTGAETTDGNTPPGYPVVGQVTNAHDMTLGPPTGVTPEEWAYFARRVTWTPGRPDVGLAPVAFPR